MSELQQAIAAVLDRSVMIAEGAARVDDGASATLDAVQAVMAAIADVRSGAARAAQASHQIESAVAEREAALDHVAQAAEASRGSASEVTERMAGLLDGAETLLAVAVRGGTMSADREMVLHAQDMAARIGTLFEDGVANNEITVADLFDEEYRPVPGTDPAQHMTRFVKYTDRVLPALQEQLLRSDPRIAFCAAVDRNGYLPTHNAMYSHPQSRDPKWERRTLPQPAPVRGPRGPGRRAQPRALPAAGRSP